MAQESPISIASPMEEDYAPSNYGPSGFADSPDHQTPGGGADAHNSSHFGGLSALPSPARAGATVIDPDAEVSSSLNPRSCVTCRRRKVRCDKHMPCGNCRKAHISCIFPAPGRAPRRPRPKDPNAPPKQTSERELELMRRLRKLEGIVEDLSGQIEYETRHPSNGASPEEAVVVSPVERERRKESAPLAVGGGHSSAPPSNAGGSVGWVGASSASPTVGIARSSTSEFSKDFGRLVLNDKGKMRYVSSAFWSKMNDEIDQLRAATQRLTDDESDYSDEDGSTPATTVSAKDINTDHHSFIFGYRSADVDLRKLHPLPSQIPFIWQVYTENVDPLVKILHKPTMDAVFRNMRKDMNSITPGMEALLFAIYFGAITSMEEEEVMKNFGAEKSQLVQRFQFGTEQALAKANFLNSLELVVIQAFTLFVILVKRYDESRFSWTLTGLLIRISQSLGLHRDGTHFPNLKPFEIEMRRRLWWAILVVDLRAAEDQGTELCISERVFDTMLPANIDDNEMWPEMTEFPNERNGITEQTFCLVRYSICSIARRLHSATNSSSPCPKDANLSLEEREHMLKDVFEHVNTKFLSQTSEKDSELLTWVASSLARLIMAKIGLFVYQPYMFPATGEDTSPEIRDRLLISSIDVVEYNRILANDPRCKQYRWLFQTYTQWNAVSFILLEICHRPWSALVERGWQALQATFRNPNRSEYEKMAENSAVIIPLRKLMVKTTRHREHELARLRADPQAAEDLDSEDTNRTYTALIWGLPSSIRNSVARESWRKLVGRPPGPPSKHDCINADDVATISAKRQLAAGNNSGDNGAAAPAPPPMDSGSVNDALQSLMTNPGPFEPQDIWSVLFQGKNSATELGLGQYTGELPPGGMPPNSTDLGSPLPATTSNEGMTFPHGSSSSISSSSTVKPGQAPSMPGSMPPLTTTSPPESTSSGNPPPWLWSHPWGMMTPADTLSAAGSAGGGLAGGASGLSVTGGAEVDVNMDEDFDWSDWQQSMRSFDMGGMNMTGGGFSGTL